MSQNLLGPERDLFAEQVTPLGQYRCAICCRADVPEGRLGLIHVAHQGSFVQACTICELSAEARSLATSGAASGQTECAVEDGLRTLYLLLRTELEAQVPARDGRERPRGEGEGTAAGSAREGARSSSR